MKNTIATYAPKAALVSVGCDPELFVLRDKSPFSAIPIFPGSKGKEEPLLNYQEKKVGGVIHDNVTVEFTMEPALTGSEFQNRINVCKSAIYNHLAKWNKGKGGSFTLSSSGSYIIPEDQLQHPEARTFGCSEDFSAWADGTVNRKPNPRQVGQLRAAGGHIHVGTLADRSAQLHEFLSHEYGKVQFIKLLDMSLGQYVAHIEAQRKDRPSFIKRRSMYGAAGCYRPKPYGVEYRSPSSAWLDQPHHQTEVFRIVQVAAKLVADAADPWSLVDDLMEYAAVSKDEVVTSINTSSPIKKLYDLFWRAVEER